MMTVLFFLLAGLSLASVIAMIFFKDQAYNALFLVLAFACLGGLFGLLGAPFVAVVQVIIYAGAIMVLFVFILMMIRLREGMPPERKKLTVRAAVVIALVLAVELGFAVKDFSTSASGLSPSPAPGPKEIGRVLFTTYLYPFEITSVLILAALVGAIVLTKKKEDA